MVYDNTSNVFVMFGGKDGTQIFGDTWLYYDGNDTWAQVFPPGSPTPRYGHAMVYDFFNDVVILFGGHDGAGVLADTYTYSVSGNIWMNMNPGNAPPERQRHDMAYDADSHNVILFGGNDESDPFNDTWTYEVSLNDWAVKSPSNSPSPRYSHSMAFDVAEGLTVLFGGSSGTDMYNDTWIYDFGLDDWSLAISPQRPTARRDQSIAYDPHFGPLLFGGWENSDTGASEQWDVLNCNLISGSMFTTLTKFGDYLYIGSADLGGNAWIYRYSDLTGICEPWNNTGDYFVYAAFEYDGYLFFGTRNNSVFAEGNLFYTDGDMLNYIPGDVWWRPDRPGILVGGWVQEFEEYDGDLFVSGSVMISTLNSSNNFFVKKCTLAPCTENTSWSWTNTTKDNIDLLDDGLTMEVYENNLYLGTYDYATVLRYYPSNDTWWLSLNGSLDGPRTKEGRGVFSLIDYDGCLYAFTVKEGWNWTLCQTDGVWTGGNETRYNNFLRGEVFRDKLYLGANATGSQRVTSYDGKNWTDSLQIPGDDSFLYISEFHDSLVATAGTNVYRKRVIQNDLWVYQTAIQNWIQLSPVNVLPSPRQGHSLSYDLANSVLVLFGGRNESSYLNDTWIYNKSTHSGVYTSSTIDTAVDNLPTFWNTISWQPTVQLTGTQLRFQLASNNDSTTWVFRGPDGTSGSYYDNPIGENIWSGHQGHRYLRYRAYFSTSTPLSPKLESISISYFRPPYPPSLLSPDDGIWTNNSRPDFFWQFQDADSSDTQGAYQVLIDDDQAFTSIDYDSGMIMSSDDHWQPATAMDDGTWYWTVRTMDNNGFWSEANSSRILRLDTERPFSSISNLTSSTHYSSIDFINGTSEDLLSGVNFTELSLREVSSDTYWSGIGWQAQGYWLSCAGNESWVFDTSSVGWISERLYSVRPRATDIAGNMESPSSTLLFAYDPTSPTVTLTNPVGAESLEGGRSLEIKWDATDTFLNESSVRISYSSDGGANWVVIASDEFDDGFYNWTLPRMKMELRIRVEASDFAGNSGFDTSDVFYVRAPPKEDWLASYWWVILIIALLATGLIIYYMKKKRGEVEEEVTGPPPIIATAGETTLCAVCLGTVKEGLSVIKCGDCGKTFHEKCAARIEKCPNCESKLDTSEVVEE
ncbi:MAG: hypothetical protein JSV43_00695 [Methanobacteriota archaeon]|nr:MAG: hypothetical protein JSV43_00695 [Euryarchaeota archaeon]